MKDAAADPVLTQALGDVAVLRYRSELGSRADAGSGLRELAAALR